MATLNGFGTIRYDWSHQADGTSEATLWVVAAFLPLVPVKRQRLLVVSDGLEPRGAANVAGAALAAAAGIGSGFHSHFQVLEALPLRLAGVIRTYVLGWVVMPLAAFGVPLVVCLGSIWLLRILGFDLRQNGEYVVIPLGIASVGWAGFVIAKALDRAAGRQPRLRPMKFLATV